jgi:hypothetical protein
MAGIVQTSLPISEPVSLSDALNFLKQPTNSADSTLVTTLITAARQYVEDCTGLVLAPRNYVQSLDSFPAYPYSREPYGQMYGVGALSLYFGYGPILPTQMPPYGMQTSGRMPYQITLLAGPVTAIDHIEYVDATGNVQTLLPGQDFVADMQSSPARVTPLPGGVWPQCTLVPNCVRVFFTAGYNANPAATESESDTANTTESPDTPATPSQQPDSITVVVGIPQTLYVAILLLVAHWYANREVATPGVASDVPHGLQAIIDTNKILDFSLGAQEVLG